MKNKIKITRSEKKQLINALILSHDSNIYDNSLSENQSCPSDLSDDIKNNILNLCPSKEPRKKINLTIKIALTVMGCFLFLFLMKGIFSCIFISDSPDYSFTSIDLDALIHTNADKQIINDFLETLWLPSGCSKLKSTSENGIYYICYEYNPNLGNQLYGNLIDIPSKIHYWQINCKSANTLISKIGCSSKIINDIPVYYLYNDDTIVVICLDNKYGYVFSTEPNGAYTQIELEKMATSISFFD